MWGYTLKRIAVVWCVMWFVGAALAGDVRYVDDDAPLGGDGLTWETAYTFLQDALVEADGGAAVSEIRIAQGVHTPDQDEGGNVTAGDREATFRLLNGLAARGGYRGAFDGTGQDPDDRDLIAFESILTGDLLGDDVPAIGQSACDADNIEENSYHVVTTSGADRTAELDGFTITAGHASDLPALNRSGAGVLNISGSPTVTSCVIRNNCAFIGGGMYTFQQGSPIVAACTFQDNHAFTLGGGMYCGQCSPTIQDSVFLGNTTDFLSGAIHNAAVAGGVISNCSFSLNQADDSISAAVQNVQSNLTFIDCVFTGNLDPAMANVFTDALLVNCRIAGNIGLGITNRDNSTATLINCVITDNSGYGVDSRDQSVSRLTNCTIANNQQAGINNAFGASAVVWNCLVWGNQDQQIDPPTSVQYSNVQGGYEGRGNISADPLFGAAYRLTAGSPCIDAGDNTLVPPDEFDLDGDGDTAERIPIDFDDHPRFYDDLCMPNTGNPDGINPLIDMGAFEFQDNSSPLGDFDRDCVICAADLAVILGNWGPAPPSDPVADLNDDGVVGPADLAIVLGNWGPCP